MAVSLTINGTGYSFPQTGDESWGDNVTAWAQAVSQHLLQKSGGTFALSAEVDFGGSFGLKSLYVKSRGTNPSATGVIRLANGEAVSWRNAANSADLALSVNSSNNLQFNGVNVLTAAASSIARSVIAAGTANHVVINDGSGNLSSEAALAVSRGGTGLSVAPTNGYVLTGVSGAPSWQPASLAKNYIINGGFDVFQRSTSIASIAAGADTYVADRFCYSATSTSAVVTVARSTDVPTLVQSGFQSSYSLLVDTTTADLSDSAGDVSSIQYRMEGYDYAALKNQTVTLSFWVKSTKTGTFCVSFRNNGADRSYVAEYTVNSSDTWEKKTVTVTLNPSGGTDDFTNGIGLRIGFTLMSGTTYQTTAGAWQTGNFHGTSNQVNALNSTSHNFLLSQVCLNVGATAVSFVRSGGTFADELALCQRYYEKSYDTGTAPASATSNGSYRAVAAATASLEFSVRWNTTKRSAPTVTVYSATGASGNVRNTTDGADVAATADVIGENGCRVYWSATSGKAYGFHAVADSEL